MPINYDRPACNILLQICTTEFYLTANINLLFLYFIYHDMLFHYSSAPSLMEYSIWINDEWVHYHNQTDSDIPLPS